MKIFVENENSLTCLSRFDDMENYDACNKKCRKNSLHPFQMQDFYNYADQLNQTNFYYMNDRTEYQLNSSNAIEMRKMDPEETKLCTDVKYDFERRKWTDDGALENMQFIHQWEDQFKQLWDHKENVWPRQPYQPEFVVLYYEVSKTKHLSTIALKSFALVSETKDEFYYKCLDSNSIQRGYYFDAFEDCGSSNSSFQTYLYQVSLGDNDQNQE